MEKIRVYELAKEMNTTSKRLMEKLSEINIDVKNHMSLLEDHELSALYKHIGVVKHDDKKIPDQKAEIKHSDSEDSKAAPTAHAAKPEQKKDAKSAPRIIRKTEIIINSPKEAKNTYQQPYQNQGYNGQKGDVRKAPRPEFRSEYVKSSDSNSGLRAGYVRDTRQDFLRDAEKYPKKETPRELPKDINQTTHLKPAATDIIKDSASEVLKDKQADMQSDNIIIKPAQHIEENVKPAEDTPSIKAETKPEVAPIVSGEKLQEAPQPIQTPIVSRAPETVVSSEPTAAVQSEKVQEAAEKTESNVEQQSSATSQETRPQGDRPAYQGTRPQGDRPAYQQGERPGYQGTRPQGDRPAYQQGDRPGYQGTRPQGDRPAYQQGDRPGYQGTRPQGDRPAYQQGDRPGYQGTRPQGDRPAYQQGDRPGYQGTRPQGDRPAYQQGDRPGYQGTRPQGDRPAYQQGDRPGYQGTRPQGDRPAYQGTRPPYQQGDRPGYQGTRPQGDRPAYQQGDRPGYQGTRPQGDRPAYQGSRPPYQQGDRPSYQQGDRPGYQGNRPPYQQGAGGYRPSGGRPGENQKSDSSLPQKDELTIQKSEIRREFSNKDQDKYIKNDQKRDQSKAPAAARTNTSNKRFKPQTTVLNEKKGVSEILSEDFILNEFYSSDEEAKKKRTGRSRRDKDLRNTPQKYIPARAVLSSVTLPESITVKDLAETLKKTSTDVIKKLMNFGLMATLNQEIDFDTATIISEEFGIKTEKAVIINDEDILFDDAEETDESLLIPRPPVVVVMGHVDHGKTSLLDAIRSANVIDSEAGGITQHIGAYTVKIQDRNITFLDTPGHEAFTAMRARGAQVTDIAILVVAADDGVMPQTIEAINHAKAAKVSIIVAINKIDKPGANPEKIKQELTKHGLVSEEWGGDVICVPVSAKKHENIDQLLEMVLLTADVLELKANPNKQAKGTVIEAKLDKNRGPLATVLVQRGSLNVGDSIVTGTTVGRIRAMTDDKGQSVKTAGPSTPVEILGLPEVPEAGELFYAITDEKVARHLAERRKLKLREDNMKVSSRVTLEDLYSQIKEGKVKDLNLIVKADVQGSVEAVKQSLGKLNNEEVRVNIIHGGVGAITETDVALAGVSNAIIIGFNVRPGTNVTDAAGLAGVDIRLYTIIYKAIEDIEAAMKGMLEPTYREVVTGHVEIRQIFKVSGVGTIGGCYVTDGKITRNTDVRVLRSGVVVFTGKLASLKRFKDDAREVAQGFECGLSVEKYNDIREGDVVEAYVMEAVER